MTVHYVPNGFKGKGACGRAWERCRTAILGDDVHRRAHRVTCEGCKPAARAAAARACGAVTS